MIFYKKQGDHILLFLRVTPNSFVNKIGELQMREDESCHLQVRVRAVPEKGGANKAVIATVGKWLKCPKSEIEISAGATSRFKTLRLPNNASFTKIFDALAK